MNIRISQIPKTPQKLVNFILSLEDGGIFTIPEMQKATGFSWHTCNLFIRKWPERFRPSIVGRSKGPGRPFIYKLLKNAPDEIRPGYIKRLGGGFETGGAPEIWIKNENKKDIKARTDMSWETLPGARKINALKALFPNGIDPEQYAELFGIVEFIERVSMSLWYKRTEIQKKD